jgi:hypothetical protein
MCFIKVCWFEEYRLRYYISLYTQQVYPSQRYTCTTLVHTYTGGVCDFKLKPVFSVPRFWSEPPIPGLVNLLVWWNLMEFEVLKPIILSMWEYKKVKIQHNRIFAIWKDKRKNPLQITFCHNFSMFLTKDQKDVVATESLVKRITKTTYFLSFSLSHKDAHACL